MQLVNTVNQRCADNLPFYSEVAHYTAQKYQQGQDCFNNLYTVSTNKAKKVKKASKQLRNDLLWMLSQTADDLIELIESKLEIDTLPTKAKGKTQRLVQLYNSLKKQHLLPYIEKVMETQKNLCAKGRSYQEEYMAPLLLRVRATVEVSRQIMMEALATRISDLKMTYKFSKDTVTMFWNGEFKEEATVEKMKEKLGCLKECTVNFVQKGMEIKISRQNLAENYHQIMVKLSELTKEVGTKSVEQWTETKTRTIDLYQTVLRRIKNKERVLSGQAQLTETTETSKKQTAEPVDEQKREAASDTDKPQVPEDKQSSSETEE